MKPLSFAPLRAAGFTLLEVMVALLIFALFAAAVQRAASQYYGDYERIEAKTLATWIAENRVAELRLASSLPPVADNTDETDFAGEHWRVETNVKNTQDSTIRRVDVTVSLFGSNASKPKQQLVFSGFVGKQ